MQTVKRILIISLVVIIALMGISGAALAYYANELYSQLNRPTPAPVTTEDPLASVTIDPAIDQSITDDTPDEEIGIHRAVEVSTSDDIYNILLFGIDSAASESGRSDVICYASINKTTGTISLISVLRDTLLEIEGHGEDKAAHAYSYGGAKLALATMNANFHTDIRDYAVVNFNNMEALIDAMGGVNIDVSKSEVSYINRGVREVNRANGRSQSDGSLSEYGESTLLTGRQAVAYARIRHLDSDYERSNRQREVLEALINKGLSEIKSNPTNIVPLVASLLPMVTTTMSNEEIISIAMAMISADNHQIVQDRIPADGDYNTGYRGSQWVIWADMDKARDRLHTHLYKEEDEILNLGPTGTPAPAEALEENAAMVKELEELTDATE